MPSTDLGAETIAEMEIHGIFPYQMAIEAHAGSRLQNAAVLRIERLRPSQKHVPHKGATRRILAPGRDDTIELGVTALLAHCRRLLHEGPLEIIQEYDRTTIRVLGVLDYVVDKANSRIFVRSAGVASRLSINELGLIEPIDSALVYENIELLAPLCTPCWLRYVAYGAGGICDHSTDEDLFQFPLWANNPHAAQLLNVICDRVFRRLRASRDFRRLRSTLSFWLLQAIGADTVDLALRARTVFKRKGLLAADVNLVWKYCRLYQRMDRENPRLLPVLSAWLRYRGFAVSRGLDDAVPSMR